MGPEDEEVGPEEQVASPPPETPGIGRPEAQHGKIIAAYRSRRTDDRVPGISPDLVTRFERRARRRARVRNAERIVGSYEWVPVQEGGRWKVIAFQCVLERVDTGWRVL